MHRPTLWALASLVFMAAPVQAGIELGPAEGPSLLQPGESVVWEYETTIDCPTVLTAAPNLDTQFSIQASTGLSFARHDRQDLDRTACLLGGGFVSQKHAFAVTASPGAPGLQPLLVEAVASFGQETSNTDTTAATVAYSGGVTLSLDQPNGTGKPQSEILFLLTVTNFANARTQVDFELLAAPDKGHVLLPASILLDTPSGGGEQTQATVPVVYQTPFQNGWNDDDARFVLRAVPRAAADPTMTGPASDVEFFAHSEGRYVPGLGLTPLMVALMAAFVLRRRS